MQNAQAKKTREGNDEIVHVRMLGEFSITYHGEKIHLERNSSTKAMHLLQYLLYHGKGGATREYLTELLYGGAVNVLNPHNNLKVNIFRLRRLLNHSGLPKGEYIVYQNGKYAWRSELEVQIDALMFDSAIQALGGAPSAKRPELLAQAVSLYGGDFLPGLQSETWASGECARYRELFLELSEKAIGELAATNRFEESCAVAARAAAIHPYEEKMHLLRISALLNLRRYSEALSAYDEASRVFLEDLGIAPSIEMREIYHRITGSVSNTVSTIEEVRDSIRRDSARSGAYYCNYPGFIDSFLFVSRLAERNGSTLFFMLSTITDTQGIPFESKSRLSGAAECLQGALFDALRGSDLYTRYSPCQYLTLLTGIDRENCAPVAARVNERYRERLSEYGMRGVRASHSFCTASVSDITGRELSFTLNPWEE